MTGHRGSTVRERLGRFVSDGRFAAIILFLPPALFLFTYFVAAPLVDATGYAGYRWSGYGEPTDWIGSRNFGIMIDHSAFRRAVINTLLVVAVSVFIQIPLAIALAMMLAEQTWSNVLFRLIFFMPFIMAEVATGLLWSFLFDGDYGVSAAATQALGTEPFHPLSDRFWAFPAILFVVVWKYFGFHMMIFVAALQNVSQDVVDAARMDGASRRQIAWLIKLPALRPAIAVSAFIAVLGSLQLYDLIAPMTGGGPSHSTHTLVSYLYTFGLLRLKVGFGSAVGVVLFAACAVFALLYQNALNRRKARDAQS